MDLPSGAILLYDSGSECPQGYTRLSAVDDRWLMGGASYVPSGGGAASHQHDVNDHNHTFSFVTDTVDIGSATWGWVGQQNPIYTGSIVGHKHTIAGFTQHATGVKTNTVSNIPASLTMLLCRKD